MILRNQDGNKKIQNLCFNNWMETYCALDILRNNNSWIQLFKVFCIDIEKKEKKIK